MLLPAAQASILLPTHAEWGKEFKDLTFLTIVWAQHGTMLQYTVDTQANVDPQTW